MKKIICNLVLVGTLAATTLLGSAGPAAAHTPTPTDYCSYVPDYVPGLFDFRHACAHHDYAYRTRWTGSRSLADTYFKWGMEAECRNRHSGPSVGLTACLGVSKAYYAGVRLYGYPAWVHKSIYVILSGG